MSNRPFAFCGGDRAVRYPLGQVGGALPCEPAKLMDNDRTGAYVDAVAALLAMPLDGVDRAVVLGVTERLAAYAADVAAVELAIDVEIAGRFEP